MGFRLVRFINIILLACVSVLTLTGVYGLFWTLDGWVFDVHRAAGWVLIACIPWKTIISVRSLRRGLQPNFQRGVMVGVSLLLATASLAVLVLGLAWVWRLGPAELWLRQTAISWHWMLALGLLAPFILHVWRRWPRPKKVDLLSRRAALRMIAVGAAGLAGWRIAEALAAGRALADAPRRFTGSRLDGQFSGNLFPVTESLQAGPEQVNRTAWQLRVEGSVARPRTFRYEELLALPASSKVAMLDCTLGWYTTQTWSGVPLRDLLDRLGASPNLSGVRLESVTGYSFLIPVAEVDQVLLATHVGGETLNFEHGFPLRAVVPSRRGWFWVKWLGRIEIVEL